jgi:3-deoxy-7-phosphoheptulonate synthase
VSTPQPISPSQSIHPSSTQAHPQAPWSPSSWQTKPNAQQIPYEDPGALIDASNQLHRLPPLVTSWEIEHLKKLLAEAQDGKRFLLQGGDCAETLADCTPEAITAKLKILLQMSVVLVHGGMKPVIRIGRFAGQYSKPRSSASETRTVHGQSITLPSYFGDLVNQNDFTPDARRPDPHLMVRGYKHAALTLNFIRSLLDGGFADLHHPEYWNLSFFSHDSLSSERKAQYEQMTRNLADGLKFMEALGEKSVDDLTRAEFFTSHEGLLLPYETAQTRQVPRRQGWYNLTTHLPWVGERTRQLDGAHIEYFRGIQNPVGVKLGPTTTPQQALDLALTLNPANEPGKLVFITRFGAGKAHATLPGLIQIMQQHQRRVLWVSDPMHGNMIKTASGIKTRLFNSIAAELQETYSLLASNNAHLGGVHFEMTGEDVTECLGGGSGVTEDRLNINYASLCDPRLNYAQALELAFFLAGLMRSQTH